MKIRPTPKHDGPTGYSIGRRSYYQWRVGNCAYFALDTRSHRLLHDGKKPAKADTSILGAEQRAWLKEEMAKSDADFFFVVSSVPFMIPHDGSGGMAFMPVDKNDSWAVYLHEREELIRFWETLNRPVVVLTGDLHNSFAIKITEKVWEFCCGPHNSSNHPTGSEGRRPPTGTYQAGNRACDIRWSSYFLDDTPQEVRRRPIYCVIQANNVFNNPPVVGRDRWVAYPHPQLVLQYYDGRTGDLLYAEAIRK